MFDKIKNDILGKEYSLSIAFVSEEKSREINKKYRKKDKPTNVLSFSLRENEGELVLCKTVIQREARDLKKNFKSWLLFLVIHGMLHLKGMEHSSTMEKAEALYYKRYDQKHLSRNRHRILHDPGGGRRIRQRTKRGKKS